MIWEATVRELLVDQNGRRFARCWLTAPNYPASCFADMYLTDYPLHFMPNWELGRVFTWEISSLVDRIRWHTVS